MKRITVDFSDETLTALETYAATEYAGDRDAAAKALLDDWLDEQ